MATKDEQHRRLPFPTDVSGTLADSVRLNGGSSLLRPWRKVFVARALGARALATVQCPTLELQLSLFV